MKRYKPTPMDVACDLIRCVYFSKTNQNFSNSNFVNFLSHAEKILPTTRKEIAPKRYLEIKKRIAKAKDVKMASQKRQEDLLTAATLLQLEYNSDSL